jgi:hypothetical protein
MGKSYKEELAEFKQYRLDPERLKRTYPKAKKLKPYKVTGIFGAFGPFSNREVTLGRYATPKDAKKAMEAALKSG